MVISKLYCEVCACETEHAVDSGDDDGEELALCLRCGRMHSPSPQDRPAADKPSPNPSPAPCRHR